ncbi:uncharacterized protein A4U43_C05F34150 [Asparagus officinalis]|uniref:Uncharacterized protein n=1 Tax=Asparagus officinalis TaxID=4686 RepID=A0A5P1F225_ASPOF|nr:uncharacterized protein A4U43_C05F34150 [Asparagus officinalis]
MELSLPNPNPNPSPCSNVALVVGVTGMVGSSLVDALKKREAVRLPLGRLRPSPPISLVQVPSPQTGPVRFQVDAYWTGPPPFEAPPPAGRSRDPPLLVTVAELEHGRSHVRRQLGDAAELCSTR